MSNLVKLPNGGGLDVSLVQGWSKLHDDEYTRDNTLIVAVNGQAVTYYGPDARALYAWLEANSVAIDERGREVKTRKLTHHQLRTLTGLKSLGVSAFWSDMAEIAKGITASEFDELIEWGYIVKDHAQFAGERYILSETGRDALKAQS